jgi:hypothetical protein
MSLSVVAPAIDNLGDIGFGVSVNAPAKDHDLCIEVCYRFSRLIVHIVT